MHRPVLRALLGRRPDLARAAGQRCRSISSTSPLLADADAAPKAAPPKTAAAAQARPSKPTPRQRSAAAASQLGALGNTKGDAPGKGIDARSLAASGINSLTASNQIINVRSLPRQRPGGNPPGPSGVSTPGRFANRSNFGIQGDNRIGATGGGASSNGFSRRPGGPPGGRTGGGASFAGRRPGGARGRAKGGRGRSKRDDDKNRGGKDAKARQGWTAEQQKWLDGVQQGVAAPFAPSLTLESLLGHGPATSSAGAGPAAQIETALRGMRLVAGGEAYCADVRVPEQTRDQAVEGSAEGRPVFFHDVRDREFARGVEGLEEKPSEEVKQAIMQAMFAGRYTEPTYVAASDTIGTVQSYHYKDVTYMSKHDKSFEDKVQSLLPAQKGAAGAAKGGKGKQAQA